MVGGRAAVAGLALVLQMVAGVGAVFDVNLCIADDGHASLEFAHSRSECRQEVARHHPDLSSIEPAEFAHHPCRDLSLATDHCATAAAEPRIVSVGGYALVVPATEAIGLDSAMHHPDGVVPRDFAVLHRRTVVLLV